MKEATSASSTITLVSAITMDSSVSEASTIKEPSQYVKTILPIEAGRKRSRWVAFQKSPTTENMDCYDMKTVQAIRNNDVSALRSLLEEGTCFDACNRNGETLLHLACRRSSVEVVDFLVNEAGVNVNVQDDMGRTCLHDVCWRPTANLELMQLVLEHVSPELLLAEDARGHTCLDYCRKNEWPQWIDFLKKSTPTLKLRSALVEAMAMVG